MTTIPFIIVGGFLIGYLVCLFFTHPKRLKNKLPSINVGRLYIAPNIKIKIRGRFFHLHHWVHLTIIFTVMVYLSQDIFVTYLFWKGIVLGGISQGLTYKDRFKFRE